MQKRIRKLEPRHQRTADIINSFLQEKGRAPTLEELAKQLGVKCKSAQGYVAELKRRSKGSKEDFAWYKPTIKRENPKRDRPDLKRKKSKRDRAIQMFKKKVPLPQIADNLGLSLTTVRNYINNSGLAPIPAPKPSKKNRSASDSQGTKGKINGNPIENSVISHEIGSGDDNDTSRDVSVFDAMDYFQKALAPNRGTIELPQIEEFVCNQGYKANDVHWLAIYYNTYFMYDKMCELLQYYHDSPNCPDEDEDKIESLIADIRKRLAEKQPKPSDDYGIE